MKNILAVIGGIYLLMAILGSLDIGNFFMYYGPNKPPITWCQK